MKLKIIFKLCFVLYWSLTAFMVIAKEDAAALTNVSTGIQQTQSSETSDDNEKIPYKKENSFQEGIIFRVVLGLLLAVSLAIGVVYLLKRYNFSSTFGAGAGKRYIKLLEVKRLSPKLHVFLISVNDKTILLAQSGDSVAFYNGRLKEFEVKSTMDGEIEVNAIT